MGMVGLLAGNIVLECQIQLHVTVIYRLMAEIHESLDLITKLLEVNCTQKHALPTEMCNPKLLTP